MRWLLSDAPRRQPWRRQWSWSVQAVKPAAAVRLLLPLLLLLQLLQVLWTVVQSLPGACRLGSRSVSRAFACPWSQPAPPRLVPSQHAGFSRKLGGQAALRVVRTVQAKGHVEPEQEAETQAEAERDEQPEPPLWAGFHGIFCINLERRPERWRFMQRQLQRLGVPAQRFTAVDGRDLEFGQLVEGGLISIHALPRYLLPDEEKVFGIDLTPGAIGCALSHIQIWTQIVERHGDLLRGPGGRGPQAPRYLVIEDDCRFLPSFGEAALESRLREVPSDWEICWLGGVDSLGRQAALQVAPGVRRVYAGFRTTTAYAITVRGAKSALEVCLPLMWQVDTHLTQNELAVEEGQPSFPYTVKPMGYSLYPPLVEQAKELFGTDVQKDDMEHKALRQAVLPEGLDAQEPLLLLGTCNAWSIEEALQRHCFQPVRKPGRRSQASQESSVRVEVPAGGLFFQVISARHFWEWRLYPSGGEDPACRELRRGEEGKVVACLASGQNNNLAHGRDFLIREPDADVVDVRVSVSTCEGIRVWYT